MGDNPGSDGGSHGAGVMFWLLMSIIVVGLVLMIVLPLAGR